MLHQTVGRYLLPDCRTLYPDNDFIFQQDGAPSYTSRITQEHLDANTPEFIGKDDWPPQSPDLNPMDYHVWDSLSEKLYEGRSTKFTERELKQKISNSGNEFHRGEFKKPLHHEKNVFGPFVEKMEGQSTTCLNDFC